MAQEAYLNDTIRILVTFRDFDGEVDDPTELYLYIYEGSASPVESSTAETSWPAETDLVRVSVGKFYYDWTPTTTGDFVVRYYAIFGDSGATPPTDVVDHEFTVIGSPTLSEDTPLGIDTEVSFAGIISPLYVNPDELIPLFPEASELEIAEAIWVASVEVKTLLKYSDTDIPGPLVLEYVRAAAACQLSRVHASSMGDELNIRLGDLSVTTRNSPKNIVNRGNATTWCELAAALRTEVLLKNTSAKTFVAGSDYYNPIPERKIRREDLTNVPREPIHQGLLDGS